MGDLKIDTIPKVNSHLKSSLGGGNCLLPFKGVCTTKVFNHIECHGAMGITIYFDVSLKIVDNLIKIASFSLFILLIIEMNMSGIKSSLPKVKTAAILWVLPSSIIRKVKFKKSATCVGSLA